MNIDTSEHRLIRPIIALVAHPDNVCNVVKFRNLKNYRKTSSDTPFDISLDLPGMSDVVLGRK